MSEVLINLPQLVMFKESLSDLKEISVPAQFSVRSYQNGDDIKWEKIIQASFNSKMSFKKDIEANEFFRTERVYFVCDKGEPIATAIAWYDKNWDSSVGYLHMVGMLQEYGGKGLGRQASLAALHQMKRDGRKSAVLTTDDFRIPAIKTYLKMGFKPQITHKSHQDRWIKILECIGRTELISEFI